MKTAQNRGRNAWHCQAKSCSFLDILRLTTIHDHNDNPITHILLLSNFDYYYSVQLQIRASFFFFTLFWSLYLLSLSHSVKLISPSCHFSTKEETKLDPWLFPKHIIYLSNSVLNHQRGWMWSSTPKSKGCKRNSLPICLCLTSMNRRALWLHALDGNIPSP